MWCAVLTVRVTELRSGGGGAAYRVAHDASDTIEQVPSLIVFCRNSHIHTNLLGVEPQMNFLAIAELMGILLLVLFILRALIGVRREYRVRERRLHMLCATDVSGAVGVAPDLLNQPIAPRAANRTGLFRRGIPEIRGEFETRARSQFPDTSRVDSGVAANHLHLSRPLDVLLPAWLSTALQEAHDAA